MILTLRSLPAASAPALTVSQNECETPFGITAIVFCDDLAPPAPPQAAARSARANMMKSLDFSIAAIRHGDAGTQRKSGGEIASRALLLCVFVALCLRG